MKYSFAPLRDERCEILILGSLPGEESLRMRQYYAHPRNSFWKIMFEILGEKYTDDYREKCRMMLRHHIALWDVVYSGERQGSLDSNIKNMSFAIVLNYSHFLKSISISFFHPSLLLTTRTL